MVQVRVTRDEHLRWRSAVGETAVSVADLVRTSVRGYLARRPPTDVRTPLPWVLRRATAYLVDIGSDRALAHQALDLAPSVGREET